LQQQSALTEQPEWVELDGRDQDSRDQRHLALMIGLVEDCLQAGIQAETGVFDQGYLTLWFIRRVLVVGPRQVIIPAK
jgi:hypothetical protein